MSGVTEQLSGYVMWSKAAGISAETIRVRLCYLARLETQFPDTPLLGLTASDLAAFVGRDGWKPETRKCARAAVRAFFRWAIDTDQITVDPSRKLPSVRVPAGKPKPTPDDVVLHALDDADVRTRLMVMLAAYAGLRRSEIARLHTDDVLDGELRIVGKGGRTRMVPLHPIVAEYLTPLRSGYVFPGNDQGHLSPGYVGVLIKRILGDGYSAHTLRHRFATKAYAAQRDLFAVQELLGHSKPETTRRYTALPDDALRAAVLGIA